ncbi:MAG: hypothetical protein KA146_06245 [Leptospiraceae bacterium]|nr:hypothetical protein [Leptospiraceae bacterium]
MKKRFIVCVTGSTDEEDMTFINFIKDNKLGWWHWISNVWLIVDSHGVFSVSELRDYVKEIFSGEHLLVIELNEQGDTWAGFGPATESKNMFDWIKKSWKRI